MKTSASKRTRSRRRSAEPCERRLDGRAAVAGVEHLAEQPLEVDRLGRRERRGRRSPPTSPLDRPEEAGLATRGIEDRVQQERGRRLPVRARDARDLELLRRLAEEDVGRDRHRLAHGRHDELRHVELERSLDDERGGAALDRLPGEVVPVDPLAADAEEERAGGDAPRVVGEVADLDRPAPGHLARRERPDQGIELHRAGRLVAARYVGDRRSGRECAAFRDLRGREPR